MRTDEPVQRSTLHSFWSIAGPLPNTAVHMIIDSGGGINSGLGTTCEDCDGPLMEDGAMDIGEETAEQGLACASCRRHVCDRCAVLGDARICLACAR